MKINFNAGPAALPEEVKQAAREAIKSFDQSGISILEFPHRSDAFEEIINECNELVKELCGLSDAYQILWLQGGGRMQFAMVPHNFLYPATTAAYIDSGIWSADAIAYAGQYGQTEILCSSAPDKYRHLPALPAELNKGYAYLHLTTNNTICGTQFKDPIPNYNCPLIADMSSDILGIARDYNRYDLFYAAAQKNLGIAGVTMVAVKKSFLEKEKEESYGILSYKAHSENNSLLNTPPSFANYISLLQLRWIKKQGLATICDQNLSKGALLYEELERNSLFTPLINKADRSIMNVVFDQSAAIPYSFADFAALQDIENIAGHRKVGGFRVSLYNAITIQQVAHLVSCMQDFENKYGN